MTALTNLTMPVSSTFAAVVTAGTGPEPEPGSEVVVMVDADADVVVLINCFSIDDS